MPPGLGSPIPSKAALNPHPSPGSRRAAKKQNRPEVQLEERGRDLFFNGLQIARRGDPGTPEAKWVPLVPGFRIADDGHEITIETPDLRYYFGHLVIAADQTDASAPNFSFTSSAFLASEIASVNAALILLFSASIYGLNTFAPGSFSITFTVAL
jgi:hypothetical protein